MYVETYETSSEIILSSNVRFLAMFVTAVCVLFLIDLAMNFGLSSTGQNT